MCISTVVYISANSFTFTVPLAPPCGLPAASYLVLNPCSLKLSGQRVILKNYHVDNSLFCSFSGNFASEKTKWNEEMNGLIKQLQESSQVCPFVKISPEDLEKDPTLKWVFEEILPSDYRYGLIHGHQDMWIKLELRVWIHLNICLFFITGIFALKFKSDRK